MSIETLDELLEIKMNGPKLEDFDFRNAIEDWKAAKQKFLFNILLYRKALIMLLI